MVAVAIGAPEFPPGSGEDQRSAVGTGKRLSQLVGRNLDEIAEIARRGSLPPGVVRDVREQLGLHTALWDAVQRVARQVCRGR